MAKLERRYGINIQICIVCACYVIIAAPKSERCGAVDLAMCPALASDFRSCGGKMVPVTNEENVSEILEQFSLKHRQRSLNKAEEE